MARNDVMAPSPICISIGLSMPRVEIGNRATEGLALLRKSFTSLYGEKNPEEGLMLTMRTAELTKGVSHVLTGLSVLHSAEAYAMLGQRSECERALSVAEAYLDQTSNGDVAIDLFSEDVFGRLAGSCYLSLNQARRAEIILETAAQDLRLSKSQAIVLGNLSLACLRQNRPDDAALVLHRAIDLVELNWGGGGLSLIFAACRELGGWQGKRHLAVVQDVLDRVMTLVASS